MICFIRLERISVSPMLPAGLLKNSIFRKSAFIGAMGYVALFGLILYVPYLLQVILKKDAAFSGVMMLPMTLSMVVGGMLGGALISRYQHYRRSGIVNLSIAIVGLLLDEKSRQLNAWIISQRAHAVANGLPVVSVNRMGHEPDPSGQTNGIQFWGNSFVAGPQGEFLIQASNDKNENLLVEIDLERSENVRRWWPFLRDRRIDEYGGLTKRFLD